MDFTGHLNKNSCDIDLSNKSPTYHPYEDQPTLAQRPHNGQNSSRHNHRATSNVDHSARDALSLNQQPISSGNMPSASRHSLPLTNTSLPSRIRNPMDTPITTNPTVHAYQDPNVIYGQSVPEDHFDDEPKNIQPKYVHQVHLSEEPTGDILDLDSKQIVQPSAAIYRDRLPPTNPNRLNQNSLTSNSRAEPPTTYTAHNYAPPRIFYYSPQQLALPPVITRTQYNSSASVLTPGAASLLEASNRCPVVINTQYNSLPDIQIPAVAPPNESVIPNSFIATQHNLTPATSPVPLQCREIWRPPLEVADKLNVNSSKLSTATTAALSNPALPSTPTSPAKSRKRKSSVLLKTPKRKEKKRVTRRSNEKKLKTYNCSNCDKWFTTTGHLRRHFRTPLHKSVVEAGNMIDAATFPSRLHHFPDRIHNLQDCQSDDSQSQSQPCSLGRESDCVQDDSEPPDSDDELDTSQSSQSQDDHPNGQSGDLRQTSNTKGAQEYQKSEGSQAQLEHQESFEPALSIQNSKEVIQEININQYWDYKNPYQDPCQKDTLTQIAPILGDQKRQLIDSPFLTAAEYAGQTILDIHPVSYKGPTPAKQLATLFGYGFGRTEFCDFYAKSTLEPNSPEFLESPAYPPSVECEPWSKLNKLPSNFFVKSHPLPAPSAASDDLTEWEEDLSILSPPLKRRKTDGPDKSRPIPKSLQFDTNIGHSTVDDISPTSASSLDSLVFSFSSCIPLTIHTKKGKRFKCDECNKEFNRVCYLTQHKNARHGSEKLFRCKVCSKRYSDKVAYDTHLARHGATEKDFQCPFCPRQYFHKTDIKRHLYSHAHFNAFTCQICEKGFTRHDHLLNHYDAHQRKGLKVR